MDGMLDQNPKLLWSDKKPKRDKTDRIEEENKEGGGY
jgi:hypothetical protein